MKLKYAHSPLNLRILSSTSVPFTLMTVQVLNLALTLHGMDYSVVDVDSSGTIWRWHLQLWYYLTLASPALVLFDVASLALYHLALTSLALVLFGIDISSSGTTRLKLS